MRKRHRPAGLQAAEVVVIVAIVGAVILLVMMNLPRRRESARMVGCRDNLMKIGRSVMHYDTIAGRLPTVDQEQGAPAGPSPVVKLLRFFGQTDFAQFQDAGNLPKRRVPFADTERRIPGLLCPSDPQARATRFPAPISYRANAGATTDGRGGPFSPGRSLRLADVQAADGVGFTAAFSERLLGDGATGSPIARDYASRPGPIGPAGCPPGRDDDWKGDAGSSWSKSDWTSTLYTHALTPDAAPSCIATDRHTARMGASGGHESGVHVLLLDGSVRAYSSRVDPGIWAGLGATDDRVRPRESAP